MSEEQDERMQEMYDVALKEVLENLRANGIHTGSVKPNAKAGF